MKKTGSGWTSNQNHHTDHGFFSDDSYLFDKENNLQRVNQLKSRVHRCVKKEMFINYSDRDN